jgi:hypothetical protein
VVARLREPSARPREEVVEAARRLAQGVGDGRRRHARERFAPGREDLFGEPERGEQRAGGRRTDARRLGEPEPTGELLVVERFGRYALLS